ncbi:glycoside hydrolase family 3 C-terminal domain-containing protein [Cellulophaga sp. HaHaR_3_176]|uniref:glycoside hydrolase family 3 N-terminal domain-containing protein n=1 Tax=Cellulophaga sp. HaHaR_3_176 TaxID=1942464 RepID=UPI001C1F4A2E|nr:glycoside hydrolase family 3 N-terminal domain-containing protein [Cellulophaga sp. HaHaR_3_176]QWX84996.1 glycoside hydrolase family 3 C-terminal domain-containing protein [Cellulophaga sp. HaHaR_3_176]
MKYYKVALLCVVTFLFTGMKTDKKDIYHKGWIDFNKNGIKDVFEDSKAPLNARVDNLISLMNVNEKTCQLVTLYGFSRVLEDEMPNEKWKNRVWKDGIANIDEHLNTIWNQEKTHTKYAFPYKTHAEAINKVQKWFIEETRMGIPVDFTNEGVHGLCHEKATPLPAPIGIGSTWNKDLVYKAGTIVGREAKALGYTNVYAPILDVARDQRWGRVLECYGEEPFHISEMGKQMVLGIQSEGVASTLKHFAVYSIPKGARDGDARTDPHVAPREMFQLHLYPFKKVIKEAAPMGIMSSYNDYDGVPVTASPYFLTELLREQYGFDGYVVSDSEAVEYVSEKHHVAEDYKEAVRQVIEAGLNVRTTFRTPESFVEPLRELIDEGKISMQTIDSRVADVLRVKFRLGLFDSPYVENLKETNSLVHTAADEEFSKQINRESLVLLKNENNLLPLNIDKIDNILVTGPLANEVNFTYSRYGPAFNPSVSVYEGVKNYAGDKAQVNFVKGCDIIDPNWPESEIIPTPLSAKEQADIDEAVEKAKQSDIIIAVVGEDDERVGETKSRTSLGLPGRQFELVQALYATGKPVVLVLINGQPLTINWENKFLPAILEAWFPSTAAGEVIAETLFGDYNPGGKLSVTFPKSVGQIPLNFPYKPGSQAGQPGAGPNGYGTTRVLGPLYPFGYGLSYTTFEYSDLIISRKSLKAQASINVSFKIKNTGKREGDEVVQMYVKDKVSSVTTYESILRGFDRIHLKANETKTVSFTLEPEDLEILDKDMNWTVEPGDFEVLIGASSEDIKLKETFKIESVNN